MAIAVYPNRLILTSPPTMVAAARPVTFQPWNGVLRLLLFDSFLSIVHFAFGVLLASPIRDVVARIANVRGFLLYYLPIMTIVGLSGLWEILESWVAQIVSPELGAAYLGAQGDAWDAQKDMAAAFYGALLWLGLSLWAHRRSARTAAEPVDTRS